MYSFTCRVPGLLMGSCPLFFDCQRRCCSVTQLCLTLCEPMDCSMPGFCPSPSPRVYSNKGVSASLPKFCLDNRQPSICSGWIPFPLPLFFPSSPPCFLYPPAPLPLLPLLFLPLSAPLLPPPLPLAPREGRKGIARVTNFRRTNWSCLERKIWQVVRSTSLKVFRHREAEGNPSRFISMLRNSSAAWNLSGIRLLINILEFLWDRTSRNCQRLYRRVGLV